MFLIILAGLRDFKAAASRMIGLIKIFKWRMRLFFMVIGRKLE